MLETIILILTFTVVLLVLSYWARRLVNEKIEIFYRVGRKGSVNSLTGVMIGGVKQWVHIRSRDTSHPVLLFLHGGPGISQIGWYDEIQRPWEDYFTVVQWDQRHAGKSYLPFNKYASQMSNDRLIADAEEVVAYLRDTLNVEKVVVMGWSHGSCLGAHLAKRRPEWLHCYVGISQSVNVRESIRFERHKVLTAAKEEGNAELQSKMETIIKSSNDLKTIHSFLDHAGFISEELYKRNKIEIRGKDFSKMTRLSFILSPYYTLRDLYHHRFSESDVLTARNSCFGEDFLDIDLPSQIGSSFEVPIVFMTCRDDWHVSSDLTDQWFRDIVAPSKAQIWFEKSSHLPTFSEPGKFLVALVEHVLPLTK